MYTSEEKICLLFGAAGVPSSKFFETRNLFDCAEELTVNLGKNVSAEKILQSNYSDIKDGIKNNRFDKIIDELNAHDAVAVTWYSADYPEQLRTIDDPPYVLFCKGDTSLLSSDCLAVVGTRKVSSYGRRVAKDFSAILCEYFTIVSGLAYGVDSVAHETTLEENGKTIAVLGGGILNVYPATNQGLADRIVANEGLLVSEYGLTAPPFAYRFPHRNRIVSGLSKGVLVCQAPAKSGTNSTVELALEQGRDVFSVPGEIYDPGFWGSNALIKSLQAACVTTPRDIVDFYGLDVTPHEKQVYQMSIDEQKIVNALTVGGQLSFDELIAQTGISPADMNFLLANLELRSIIAKSAGNSYRLYGGVE